MKKPHLTCICGALLALTASPAVADPLHLKWDDCGAGPSIMGFACNTNTATFNAYGSYLAPSGVNNLTGMEASVSATPFDGSLPAWWQYGAAPACRTTALTAQFTTPCAGATNYWGSIRGGPAGGYSYSYTAAGGDLRLICAVDQSQAGPLNAGEEYYAFTLRLTAPKTVGTGLCAGCEESIDLELYYMLLAQPAGAGDFILTNPNEPVDRTNNATWQAPTPVQNKTWGSVKSLYR